MRQSHKTISIAICILLLWFGQRQSDAQSIWEVTPYSTQVWCSFGDQPDLPEAWRQDFVQQLDRQLRVIFRATVAGTVRLTPPPTLPLLRRGIAQLDREALVDAAPSLSTQDKLFLVAVHGSQAGYQIQIREYDCQLGHFGPVETANVDVLNQIVGTSAQMIARAFSPVVRIDRYSEGKVKTRLRAGALIRGERSPGTLQPGDVLLPFDRRVGADGKTLLKNIQPVDWTYLQVPMSVDTGDVTGVTLDVVSGYRQPFRSKRNRRNQQLGLRARPSSATSVIRLQTRSKDPQPLIGYEIHEKGQKQTAFLGYTDWRGQLPIDAGLSPIRILLVRSGDRVLAKLPIVPGLRPEIVASMRDDRQRVETEGFLSGIQTALIDLVARRESLTARIRALIKAGEKEEAKKLLEQFRDLPSQTDFQREIQQQQRSLDVTDAALRKRIDTMFVQTYQTLGRYLDADRLRQLESELAAQ